VRDLIGTSLLSLLLSFIHALCFALVLPGVAHCSTTVGSLPDVERQTDRQTDRESGSEVLSNADLEYRLFVQQFDRRSSRAWSIAIKGHTNTHTHTHTYTEGEREPRFCRMQVFVETLPCAGELSSFCK